MKQNLIPQNITKSAIQWLTWADNDYISARQLILNDLLVQGSAFSNTAIEKYLKTIFIIKGITIPKVHNVANLFQKLSGIVTLKLNKEYLDLLFKLYRLRYPDDLEIGYNIAINKPKLLTQLDYTVAEIRTGFDLKVNNGQAVTAFDERKKNGDPSLMTDNCYFNNCDRTAIFTRNNTCYEFRVLNDGTFLEAHYQSATIKDDYKFDEIGLKPNLS